MEARSSKYVQSHIEKTLSRKLSFVTEIARMVLQRRILFSEDHTLILVE